MPFERRAERTAEYVAAMRTLWRDDVASFEGKFVSFDSIRVNPKPVRDRRIPVVVGVDELVLVEVPPDNPEVVAGWVSALADKWMFASRVG